MPNRVGAEKLLSAIDGHSKVVQVTVLLLPLAGESEVQLTEPSQVVQRSGHGG